MKIKNKINYYLVVKKLLRKFYVLQVTIEKENIPFHTTYFTTGIIEEVYTELFSLIKERNKIYNQEAFVHIPNDWHDENYQELLENFNSDYDDLKLSRDNINLVTKK